MSEQWASETAEHQTATPTGEAVMNRRDLRVSDDEREHVVELLQRAIGRGMLNLDEFTERTDTALAARTRAELNAVLTDLPGLVHPEAVATPPAEASGPVVSAPNGSPERLELNAHGSTLRRKGRWVVPAELAVRNKYGSTHLDFTDAQVTAPVVRIELETKWGSVDIIVPEHAAVDLNAITEIKWGQLDDKTKTSAEGSPRYVLSGKVHGGSLTIRHPRRGLFRS